jgi:hypothetical protein
MSCAKCGKDLPEGAAFCMNCGAPVKPERPGESAAGTTIDETGLFVGKNAGYYTTVFRKFDIRGMETFAPTWNWAAFLCNFWWMLYRKLYLWALLWFLLTLIPIYGIVFMIAAGITGNYLYYRHAMAKIREAKSMHPPDQLPAVLAELGGVNGWVIPLGIVVMAGFLLLAILFGIGMGLFFMFAGKGVEI